MSYKEAAEKYRSEMHGCIERDDRAGGRANAIAYASLLRRASEKVNSYSDRAFLIREADKYEYIAAVITKWGKCKELYDALADPAPHLKKAKKAPATASPTGKDGVGGKKTAAASHLQSPPPPSASAVSDPFAELLSPNKPAGGSVDPEAPAVAHKDHTKSKLAEDKRAEDSDGAVEAGVEWIADTMERCIESVWVVNTSYGAGTGFFITEDGYFLTNRHVVYHGNSREGNIWIVSHDERKKYKAIIKNVSKERDVALLQIVGMPSEAKPLPMLRDFSAVRAGCDMMIIGNGLDFGLAPITGTVKYPKEKNGGDMVYTALTNNGDSGSPVLNRKGYVIGIHKSSTSAKIVGDHRIEARGISNATPVCDILDLLNEWGVKI